MKARFPAAVIALSIGRKHGNTLIHTLRKTYGEHFAEGCRDDEKLGDVLDRLDKPSLRKLLHDRERGMLDEICRHAEPLTWYDLIEHVIKKLRAMPEEGRHEAMNQLSSAVDVSVQFPQESSRKKPKPQGKPKAKAAATAEPRTPMLTWTDDKAPALNGQTYVLTHIGGGFYDVYFMPVGTPVEEMHKYKIGEATTREEARAIAERHFAKR
jgi:hypothetical protein